MGRHDARVEDDHRWVFNRLAPYYRFRPAYPPEVVDCLVELAGHGALVADLGAGIGSLSVPLAERGLRVHAVEPARAMLNELIATAALRGLPIDAIHAAAEATGMQTSSVALALVADALHWLDPARAGAEVARLLVQGGGCAVVEVRLRQTPFVQALQARMRLANPKAATVAGDRREQFLRLAVPGGRRSSYLFLVTDVLNEEQLRGTLSTLSYAGPALGPSAMEELLDDVSRIAKEHGGAEWPREILVTHAAG